MGPNPKEDSDGVIQTPPQELLDAINAKLLSMGKARVSLSTYAVARALRSEHGSGSAELRRWVAWTIRNESQKRKRNAYDQLTKSRNPKTTGKFARQRTDARYAATNQSPRMEDIEIARRVFDSPQSADPTGGATNFFSPKTQDALYRKARAGDPKFVGRITVDAEGLRDRWADSGLVSRGAPPGVPEDEVEFFGRAV